MIARRRESEAGTRARAQRAIMADMERGKLGMAAFPYTQMEAI
jgi:hypothetical protein